MCSYIQYKETFIYDIEELMDFVDRVYLVDCTTIISKDGCLCSVDIEKTLNEAGYEAEFDGVSWEIK